MVLTHWVEPRQERAAAGSRTEQHWQQGGRPSMGPKPGASLLQDFYSFCCCWMFNWLLIKANTEPPVQHILRDWQASWWVDSLLPCKGQYFILIRIDDIPCVDLSFLLVGLSYYHHPRTQSVQLTATAETLIYDWSYTNSHQTKKSTLQQRRCTWAKDHATQPTGPT